MRKATFSSHRFQIDFGITEEDEEEIKAEEVDDKDEGITITATPTVVVEEPPKETELKEVCVHPAPPKSAPSKDVVRSVNPARRQTMPEISSEHLTKLSTKQTLSVPPAPRRPSITNLAITSSLGPSLAGIFPGAPTNLFSSSDPESSQPLASNLRKSASFSSLQDSLNLEEAAKDARSHRWSAKLPFFKLHHQDSKDADETDAAGDEEHQRKHHHHFHHHHHHLHGLPHLHVPSFLITGPLSNGSGTGRKFSFGIRRHSHAVGFFTLLLVLSLL